MNKKQYIIGTVILVVACLLSFNLGIYYTKKTGTQRNQDFSQNNFGRSQNGLGDGNQRFQNGGGPGVMNSEGRSQMGRMTAGEVLSIDGSSMTVKLRDGGSRLILLSNDTKVSKSIDGQTSDIKQGQNVVVNGSSNQDGSLVAESVQLR